MTSGGPTQYVNALCDSGRYWLEVTDANGCAQISSTSVQLGGYFAVKNVYYASPTVGCAGGTSTAVYLYLADYTNYVNANNSFLAGMTLYSNGSGGTWSSGSGQVRDDDTGIIFNITTQGYITIDVYC